MCIRDRHVHHAAAGHGRRRGHRQIGHLEDHVHEALHGDDLPTVETQLLVVVQHGVHVLDPDGVHGSVEHYPLAVGGGVAAGVAEQARQYAVRPLLRHRVLLRES
eukprot:4555116-Pyramimonas_sp.AAC.1